MDTEPPRLLIAASALAGALVWGMFHLVTAFWSGQPLSRTDQVRALVNVGAALVVGGLVAYFLGPALTPYVPVLGLKDPHVIGFGIGATAWEIAPFAFSLVRGRAKRFVKEKR